MEKTYMDNGSAFAGNAVNNDGPAFADHTPEEASKLGLTDEQLNDEKANQEAGQVVNDSAKPVFSDVTSDGNDEEADEPIATTGDNGLDALKREFMRRVGKLGADEAMGKDALPKLFIEMARAASDGLIKPAKKGTKGDVDLAYSKYLANKAKKTQHEMTKDSVKSQIAKLNTAVRAGVYTKVDFIPVLNRAIAIHKQMVDAGEKVMSAYPSYVKVASTQLGVEHELTDEEIHDAILKADPKEKTVKGQLEKVQKIVEDLIAGDSGLKDDSEEVLNIRENVLKRLAALTRQEELAELMQKAAVLGLDLTQPVAHTIQ